MCLTRIHHAQWDGCPSTKVALPIKSLCTALSKRKECSRFVERFQKIQTKIETVEAYMNSEPTSAPCSMNAGRVRDTHIPCFLLSGERKASL